MKLKTRVKQIVWGALLAAGVVAVVQFAPATLSDEAAGARATGNDPVLSVVDGREIRVSHFEAERTIAHARVMGRYRSEAKQADLVTSLADREVMFAHGWRNEAVRGRTDVKGAVAQALARALVLAEVARTGAQEAVSEEALRAAYQVRREEWREPERVRIRTILRLAPPELLAMHRAEQKARMERIRAEVIRGKSFAQFAKTESDDPENRDVGGDIGWFDVGSESIPEEARALRKVGDVSPLVELPTGYRLYAVTEVAEARTLPFESAREAIRRDIVFNRVRDRLVSSLRDGK